MSTGHEFLPPDKYVASLARKRVAATAFLRDEEGRVLVVNPVYKPVWDLPGGAAEENESPHAACRREVAEELGLDRPPGRVLAVDWVPPRSIGPDQTLLPDGVIIVYDGGILASAEVKEIVLADGELAAFDFVTAVEAARRVTPLLARRIAACMEACEAGTVAALENGSPVALRHQPFRSRTALAVTELATKLLAWRAALVPRRPVGGIDAVGLDRTAPSGCERAAGRGECRGVAGGQQCAVDLGIRSAED